MSSRTRGNSRRTQRNSRRTQRTQRNSRRTQRTQRNSRRTQRTQRTRSNSGRKKRNRNNSRRTQHTRGSRGRGRYYGRGKVKTSRFFKKTARGMRLSARAFYNSGGRVGTVHCYDGKCKRLKIRRNGSPYWG